jgi:predicted PurR-regulated permease PerM
MNAPAGMPRVRISLPAAATVVGALALTVFALRTLRSSERVIGWIIFAATLAIVLDPMVRVVQRWVPRALAVLLVLLVVGGATGIAAYGLVDDVTTQTTRLQRDLPERARDLEQGSRFRESFQEFELTKRTRELVKSIPDVLRGGTPTEAVRSAADRSAGLLATLILTIFFLAYGRRGFATTLAQIPDPERRDHWRRLALGTYRRSSRYALGMVGLSVITGIAVFAVANVLDIPGPAALAVWAGLWNLIPLFGVLVGSLPVVVLASTHSPEEGMLVVVLLLAFHAGKALIGRNRLEHSTLRVGPFLTAFAAVIGLELYGLGGALVWVMGMTVLLAFGDVEGGLRTGSAAPARN